MYVRAIYDYRGLEDHCISFCKGDVFELKSDDDPNWWHVVVPNTSVNGEPPEHIYVPATYVERLDEDYLPPGVTVI